jgi:hypothetical protein
MKNYKAKNYLFNIKCLIYIIFGSLGSWIGLFFPTKIIIDGEKINDFYLYDNIVYKLHYIFNGIIFFNLFLFSLIFFIKKYTNLLKYLKFCKINIILFSNLFLFLLSATLLTGPIIYYSTYPNPEFIESLSHIEHTVFRGDGLFLFIIFLLLLASHIWFMKFDWKE